MIKKWNWRKLAYDLFIDIASGMLIGLGIYNFAAKAEFPLAGVSGIAMILYQLFHIPIGLSTILLNIPIALLCFRKLGREFFLRSVRTVILTSVMIDYAAPLLPAYSGDPLLAALCTGVLTGLGYALIFMNNSSTGGTDFITMAIRKDHPHLSFGKIIFVEDCIIVVIGGILFGDVDGTIYGLIVTYLMSAVMDKVMYGIRSGMMALIVTDHGQEVADRIDEYVGRGSTILKGRGSYTGIEKDVVMCASSNKQMYTIRKKAHEADPKAFTIIMESNEVHGEGFQEE
jgi:uncharacterized membrane-anchored protein YitT (DUF2179 family)